MPRILVIEDEALVRDNIQDVLSLEEFDCITAEHGAIGLQLAKIHRPDLIICDVMMPELDGHGVLKALRQHGQTATIPVIFLTARASWEDVRQGMELGAEDYLTKPFTPDELLKAVNTQLTKREKLSSHYNRQIQVLEAERDRALFYDNLTQLLNLRGLQQYFSQERLKQPTEPLSLLLISLDQLNWVSSVLGHDVGEELTILIAQQLKQIWQQSTHQIEAIAHLERSKFAILLQPATTQAEVSHLAQQLLEQLSQSLTLSHHEIFMTSSVGIVFSAEASSLSTLIMQTELALSQVQKQGGNAYQFYTADMESDPQEQFAIAAGLRHGITRNEFQVFYQPQVSLRTGQVCGLEALIRWQHPQGLISPSKFIPVAEETGLILSIGEWVLQTACQQVKQWQDRFKSSLQLSVNLSARQFSQVDLSHRIMQILKSVDFNPAALDLEITESILMKDKNVALQTLDTLKQTGIQISIDDFGVGYSSLSYLQQFSFDTLKIDQSFVRNITQNPGNLAITHAIIQMAHGLKLNIIGEGVETEAELNFLQQQGCHAMQGYLFSRPLPAPEIEILLAQNKQLSLN